MSIEYRLFFEFDASVVPSNMERRLGPNTNADECHIRLPHLTQIDWRKAFHSIETCEVDWRHLSEYDIEIVDKRSWTKAPEEWVAGVLGHDIAACHNPRDDFDPVPVQDFIGSCKGAVRHDRPIVMHRRPDTDYCIAGCNPVFSKEAQRVLGGEQVGTRYGEVICDGKLVPRFTRFRLHHDCRVIDPIIYTRPQIRECGRPHRYATTDFWLARPEFQLDVDVAADEEGYGHDLLERPVILSRDKAIFANHLLRPRGTKIEPVYAADGPTAIFAREILAFCERLWAKGHLDESA